MTKEEKKRLQRPERLWDILLRVLGGRWFLFDTGRYENFGEGFGKDEDFERSGRRKN
ncbi:MAG: hypothetical protein ABIL58_14085 [Pseudomonadota bacterium]